ncbi:hypothetical protein COT77_00435 [Candidatus Berkelbacteria bacterium CG10_big_fil_rev_8_21_14_0_10_41_12]|uniref:DUF881 domain-containing protein n=1 Tax=Candidatus Berkelbacteria bacterium CG10_big_fil_rev_8_21_14_0_10_41_12 TaxID=1974513 RepID=A0A2M6WY04_9BACT|nr:MAG: hypothetical protein COT77_00435 [Candidatus Berkelbacteria bacterium CG10_big_fil_rev_8_21_14_0_10_41_12]
MRITSISKKLSIPFLLVGFLLGLFFIAQYNTKLPRAVSPVLQFAALERTEKKLESEQEIYKQQIKDTQDKIDEMQNDLKTYQSNLKGKVDTVDFYKQQAGLTDLAGEGISITLDDSPSRKGNPNSIAHASDMRDLVNYLWLNGAKAIGITGFGGKTERVGFSTSIDCIVNTVLVNNTKLVPPFKINAIGNRQNLINAIENKNGLKQIYKRVDEEGLIFGVDENDKVISVPAFNGNSDIKSAVNIGV